LKFDLDSSKIKNPISYIKHPFSDCQISKLFNSVILSETKDLYE